MMSSVGPDSIRPLSNQPKGKLRDRNTQPTFERTHFGACAEVDSIRPKTTPSNILKLNRVIFPTTKLLRMKQICLLVGIFFCSYCTAQNANETTKQKEFGVNASSFISNFLSFNNATPSTTPLSFVFKSGDSDAAFRLLAGIIARTNSSEQDGSDFSETTTVVTTFVRSGKEWRFQLGNRWRPYAGVDGFASFEKFILETNSSFDDFKTTNQTIGVGAGGVLGIQFFINDRISLLTESYLNLFYEYGLDKQEGSFSTFTQKSNAYGFTTSLPTNIYFVVSF